MSFRFLKFTAVLFFQTLLFGCAFQPDPVLLGDITSFTKSVTDLTSIVDTHFDVVEDAHRTAVQDNLNLQFELGGTPKVELADLFEPTDRAARQAVLSALQIYAARLRSAYAEDTSEEGYGFTAVPFVPLYTIKPENFDVSHSLNSIQAQQLISSLSGFSKFIFYPKRDRELAEIVTNAHPFVAQAAAILYLDLGAASDQRADCAQASLAVVKLDVLLDLKMCRGGLRGLMKTAISADLKTWQLRLQLANLNMRSAKASRKRIIKRLYDVEQAGRMQDRLMQHSQDGLIKMIAAHYKLVNRFSGKKVNSLPPYQGVDELSLDPIIAFSVQVSSLRHIAASANGFFETLSSESE